MPQVGEGLKDGAFALAKAHYVGPLDRGVVTCDHLKLMVRSSEYQTQKGGLKMCYKKYLEVSSLYVVIFF